MKRTLLLLLGLLTVVATPTLSLNVESLTSPTLSNENPQKITGEDIVSFAYRFIGCRYRRGSCGPRQFDCSGLTRYVFSQYNFNLAHSSRAQFNLGDEITSTAELAKGDLVFFSGSRHTQQVGHVGIVTEVAEDGKSFKFVHAARTGVQVDNSDSYYYRSRYLGARRIIETNEENSSSTEA